MREFKAKRLPIGATEGLSHTITGTPLVSGGHTCIRGGDCDSILWRVRDVRTTSRRSTEEMLLGALSGGAEPASAG